MAESNAKLVRIRRIMARQRTVAWGASYVPAIFATPKEAPRCSRPTILKPAKLGLRDMHLLSGVEARAALLALYDPGTFDVHEQHALSCVPAPHPLASHPSCVGKQFPRIEGTVSVANRIGRFAWHSKVFSDNEHRWVADIYVGDLLLFRKDDKGAYCVNWTIKATHNDFDRPGPRIHGRPRPRASARAVFRHELEATYFADADIRTQRVVDDEMDVTLLANLRELFCYHSIPVKVQPTERQQIEEVLADTVGGSTPAWTTLQAIAQRWHLTADVVRTLLYQAVWARRIRVDLFHPLMIDKPLRVENRDPLVVYASWFTR